MVSNTGPLYIGKDPWYEEVNGVIDEVRVYNRALSTEEVQALYQAKAKLNYGDIRFTDSDGVTELSYWMERDGRFWVKVPMIPAIGTKKIYLYYGNQNATSQSNGEATFIFFDDFVNLDKWPTTNGSISITNGIATFTQGSYIANTNLDMRGLNGAGIEGLVKANGRLRGSFGAVSRYYFGRREMSDICCGFNHLWWWNGNWYAESSNSNGGSESNRGSYTTEWQRISLRWVQATSIWYYSYSNYRKFSYIPGMAESSPFYPYIGSYDTGTLSVDFIFIRKYVEPEPSVITGDEETQ